MMAMGASKTGSLTDRSCVRVARGGSWNNNPRNLRAGYRNRNDTGNRNNNIGFRVASTLGRQSRQGHGRGGCAPMRPRSVMVKGCPTCSGRPGTALAFAPCGAAGADSPYNG